MNKLMLIAAFLLIAAAVPGLAQGVQMPNALNADPPPSINSPPLTSLSPPTRAARPRRAYRRLRRVQPRPAAVHVQ